MANSTMIGFAADGSLVRIRNRLGTNLTPAEPITTLELEAIRNALAASATEVSLGVIRATDAAYGAIGNDLANDTAALTAALTAATSGATKVVLLPAGTYKTNSLTIPSTVQLWLLPGAILSVNEGQTVTINGTIEAGQWQIFAGEGSVILGSKCKSAPVEWWGAAGDGETNDYPAIQAGLSSLGVGGELRFRIATYLTATGLTFRNSQKLVGACDASYPSDGDGELTILRFTGASGTLLAPVDSSVATRRLRIENLELDGSTGADIVIDFTRVGYSRIRGCNVRGTKSGIKGLIIEDAGSSTAYRNKVCDSRFWVSGGGSSVNISLRGNATSGANINEFDNLFVGYAARGIEINEHCGYNSLNKIDFQGVSGVNVGLYVAGASNRAGHLWFEDAETGCQVTSTGSLFRTGPIIGANVTTPMDDQGNSSWGIEAIPDFATTPVTINNRILAGRFRLNSKLQLTTVAECEIDHPPIAGNGTSIFKFFRRTTTSGVRYLEVYAGDGTDTVTLRINAATGAVLMSGSITSLINGGRVQFPAANIFEFQRGSGTTEGFVLGASGSASAALIHNNGGLLGLLRGDSSAYLEVQAKTVTIPLSTTIPYAATSTVNFSNTGVQFLTLAGNVTFATSNLADGRRVEIYLTGDASLRNLTFPATWKWVGTAPSTLAANIRAKLTLFSKGTTDADVYAAWQV